MRKAVILSFLLIFTCIVSAQAPQQSSSVPVIMSGSSDAPAVLNPIVGDQRINLHLSVNGTNQTVGLDLKGLKVNDTKRNGFNQSTLDVWIDRKDIQEIGNSEEPLKALEQKLDTGEIRYEATGMLNRLRFGAGESLFSLVQFL